VGFSGSAQFRSGGTAQFKLSVVNNGPGDAPGVAVSIDMPPTFHYKETDSISTEGGSGSVQTQSLDARVGSNTPQWGYWDLGPPDSAAQQALSEVDITFTVQMLAVPNPYTLAPSAEGDNTGGTVQGKPVLVTIVPAASLIMSAHVTPTAAKGGQSVTYSVNISNTGTAEATGLSVLITLPPVVSYVSTNMPFGGNASQNNTILPSVGGVEVFYSGFTLPAASSGGQGYLQITFTAKVDDRPVGGSYPLTAQVTDATGDVTYLGPTATLNITGALFTPAPTLTPGPT
jgi:large repetitive protein